MSKLKLEVGKTYLDRSGNEVKIIYKQEKRLLDYPFIGINQSDSIQTYSEEGLYDLDVITDEDLVGLAPEKIESILVLLYRGTRGIYYTESICEDEPEFEEFAKLKEGDDFIGDRVVSVKRVKFEIENN